MYACLHAAGNPALLVECARYFSPRIEETSSDTVLFDVRGLGALIGGPHEIARAIEDRVGIPVDIAIASDPDAAIMAARGIRGITVIAPGDEAAVLARLPLNLLPGSSETAGLLDAWGIRTLGELAMLPPLGVAARLGTCGDCVVRAIAIATGVPYAEVYTAIRRLMQNERPPRGKVRRPSPRDGVPRKIYERYLRSRGWVWVPVMGIGSGCRMHLRAAELPVGRIIARTSRHLVACVDGIVHDTHDSTRGGTRCVYGYWRRGEIGEPPAG